MKTQNFKNYINLKEDTKKAYESYLLKIQSSFASLKENHNTHCCMKLESELNTFKDFKNIKNKDKQEIYKYFVERNVKEFCFLRNNQQVQLKILKITKTHLQNYELDWKDIWQRLIRNEPEQSAIKLYSQLVEFLKNIRHLYNPNNAIQVLDYFVSRHSLYNQNLFIFISLFVNVSNKTSKEVFKAYFTRLFEFYQINQLKASNLLVMFINSLKYKNSQIDEQMYNQLNNIIISSLATPNPDKKDSIQQKFNTQTSNIIVKIIGKSNQYSVKLLEQIFQIIKNFIRPFEDSKKPLKFLYQIIGGIAKRIERQQGCKKKIQKLKEKQQKKQKRNSSKRQENDNQESVITVAQEQKSQMSEVKNAQQKEEEQEESSDEQSNQNDSDEEEQNKKIQKLVSMDLDIEENQVSQNQSKIERLQAILENSITPQITASLKTFVSQHFENIFYVNSKKIVNRLLQQLFIIFPEFVNKSFEALQKAGNIAQINEEGLISNIKHITKYLFTKQIRNGPQFLDNVLKVLNRVKQNRRITDVWQIVNIITLKIPLLDEKDLQKVEQANKISFQAKYGHNHDRFYQQYSELIFQGLKRVFSESEHYDLSTSIVIQKYIADLLDNCYPYYKKRIQKQIEEQVIQNNNKFLLMLFYSYSQFKPSAQFRQELKELIDNRNIDNQQNLSLDIHVNIILSRQLSISQVKELIRKYSKKNNYKFLNRIILSLNNFTLIYQPYKTTLTHFQTKPQFTLQQFPTFSFLSQKLKEIYQYSLQIIEELQAELKEFSSNPLKDQSYDSIINKLYGTNLADFKNLKVQKRKTINQLLQILKSLMQNLFHEMEQYDPAKNTIVLRECPYKRQSLLSNPAFVSIINILTYNELFLHDHNIMFNLSSILQGEIFFPYHEQIKIQKQLFKKQTQSNQKEQLQGQTSFNNLNLIFIAKTRLTHFSLLLNKYRDTVSIDQMERQLRILLIAPGNEKSNIINRVLVKKTKSINVQAQFLIKLLKNSFQSRFYYQKIFSLLSDFNTAGYNYNSEEIVNLIDLHVPLIQSENMKIRQHSLKSLEKLLKTFTKDNVIGNVERALRKYIAREKLEIIWIVCVIIVLKEPLRNTNLQLYLGDIHQYMKELQKLIVSQTRIIRRIALFAYSYCYRKAKKAVKKYQQVASQSEKYSQPKTISQIYEDGYLREQHKELANISNKSMLKKMQPYTSIITKTKEDHPLFIRIEQDSFSFIINNPQLGSVILKQFHTDMAGSVQQVLSMMHNKKHDLAEIIMKVLQGCYMYSKLKKLNFDRIQYYFGQRFFRYLFDKDAKSNSFKIFYQTKGFIEEHLANLQPYDNQTLVFIYTIDIFTVYQKNHKHLTPQVKEDVEKFLLKVISEIIYKGSGVLFKKLVLVFSKIIDIDSLKFIITFFENLIKSKQKLARVTQLLFAIFQQNFERFYQTTQFILNEKIEINHNHINVLINTIIALPEKFIITQNMVNKFAIIEPQKQLSQKRVNRYKKDFYLLSIDRFNSLLVQKLKDYLEQAAKLQESAQVKQQGENIHIVKSKNQLIKSVYNIVTSSISSYIQSFQTQQTFHTILQLIQILFKLFEFKMDHFVDFKYFEDTLKNIFANKYDNISYFQRIVLLIMNNLSKVPVKKHADLIKILANRPANFIFMGRQAYKQIIIKMIKVQESSMFYRDLLVGISTLLAYAPFSEAEVEAISLSLPKTQALLLLQGYVLSTLQIDSKFVAQILRESSKDRRNIFCKQILIVRGKKEYLDGQQQYAQWKQIKQYSNPYHYHV